MAKLERELREYYSLTRKVWRVFAPFYDFIAMPISKVRRQVVDFIVAKAGAKVLDVATGTGKQAFAFAAAGYNVTGVDISEDMLKIARRKNKYSNLTFMAADATLLPFENGNFDVSIISFALHDMPLTIREKVLREMIRVTKPGGTIVVVDYDLPRNRIGRFLAYNLIRLYEAKWYNDFVKSDMKGLLRGAGIEVEEEMSMVWGVGRVLKGKR